MLSLVAAAALASSPVTYWWAPNLTGDGWEKWRAYQFRKFGTQYFQKLPDELRPKSVQEQNCWWVQVLQGVFFEMASGLRYHAGTPFTAEVGGALDHATKFLDDNCPDHRGSGGRFDAAEKHILETARKTQGFDARVAEARELMRAPDVRELLARSRGLLSSLGQALVSVGCPGCPPLGGDPAPLFATTLPVVALALLPLEWPVIIALTSRPLPIRP